MSLVSFHLLALLRLVQHNLDALIVFLLFFAHSLKGRMSVEMLFEFRAGGGSEGTDGQVLAPSLSPIPTT